MNTKDLSTMSPGEAFDRLLEVMAQLRGPQGCPWDRKQDHHSLKACLLEESYEVLAAIDSRDPQELKAELGDLLLQVVFHNQIAEEQNTFRMQDILEHLIEKLIRRHPHVFGGKTVDNPEDAIQNWEKMKAEEKAPDESILSGVPRELPALLRAYRIGTKVSRVGFDWPDLDGALHKIIEEVQELQEAIAKQDPKSCEEEFGDLLFTLAQVARFLKVNPEESLRQASQKFQKRFSWMEQKLRAEQSTFQELSFEEMEQLWRQAKSFTKPFTETV